MKPSIAVDKLLKKNNGYGHQSRVDQSTVSEETLKALEPQIKKILEDNQIPLKEENIEAAKSFIRHNMEINKTTMKQYMSLKKYC